MRGWRAWLLGAAALPLLGGRSGSSSAKHSYNILWTGVSEPSQDLPWFIAGVYMGDLLLSAYNSDGKRIVPQVPWTEMLEREDPQLWQKETERFCAWELELRWTLGHLQNFYNHSQGLHTLQARTGCELNAGGQRGGHFQLGYDGEDFLTFDKETLSWITVDAQAQSLTKMWATYQTSIPLLRFFLEVGCFERLQKYMSYGKEALRRRDPPVVKVTHKDSQGDRETLFCWVHGFYPKEINVTWRKDGEVSRENMFRGVVSPNADGTYYTWLSIEINPKERRRYWCHVEHEGLQEPLTVAVEESASVPLALLVGVVLIILLLVTGIIFYIRVGKGPFSSLLSNQPPPAHPASLGADLSHPPASFQREGARAKPESADQGSIP
ncbi:major histocompatibility complex class I-related gene protein-like [Tiliqua scincoides]|uniref:major histocompatibility complex class I-related gene protein-like n=1 Tax=Tiliqua scincoides TaxID=71010 RepID=UPI003462DAE8